MIHLLHTLHHLVAYLLYGRAHHTSTPWVFAGFIIDLFTAAVAVAVEVAKFVKDVSEIVFNSLKEAVRFSVRGVAWLTGNIRKGFGELLGGLGHTFGAIGRWLGNLYCDYLDLKSRLSEFFGPVIKILSTLKKWYDTVWKQVITPVLNFIQRIRKALVLFRLFHLKWAQKLDGDLARLEGKIIRNTLFARAWINGITGWVNYLVDPLGALRTIPMVSGLLNGWNLLWSAIFGSPWNAGGAAAGVTSATTHVSVSMSKGVDDINTNSGDAGVIHDLAPHLRQRVFTEMGIKVE